MRGFPAEPPNFYQDPHPMQHVRVAKDGITRFRENAIVRWMLDKGTAAGLFNLNDIAREDFAGEDREQLAQLIGYSVSGANDLPYVSDATTNVANQLAEELSRATYETPDVMAQRDHAQSPDRGEGQEDK